MPWRSCQVSDLGKELRMLQDRTESQSQGKEQVEGIHRVGADCSERSFAYCLAPAESWMSEPLFVLSKKQMSKKQEVL